MGWMTAKRRRPIIFQAYFNTTELYPGLVNGAFFWDNCITTEELWKIHWLNLHRRNFSVRGKLAEDSRPGRVR